MRRFYSDKETDYRRRVWVIFPVAVVLIVSLLWVTEDVPKEVLELQFGWEGPTRVLPEITLIPGWRPLKRAARRAGTGRRPLSMSRRRSSRQRAKRGSSQRRTGRVRKRDRTTIVSPDLDEETVRTYPAHTMVSYSEDYVILDMIQTRVPGGGAQTRDRGRRDRRAFRQRRRRGGKRVGDDGDGIVEFRGRFTRGGSSVPFQAPDRGRETVVHVDPISDPFPNHELTPIRTTPGPRPSGTGLLLPLGPRRSKIAGRPRYHLEERERFDFRQPNLGGRVELLREKTPHLFAIDGPSGDRIEQETRSRNTRRPRWVKHRRPPTPTRPVRASRDT